MMPSPTEVQYLVLGGTANPYLLARVRWPDIFQAISAARPYWQDDPGLFDLPYDPSSLMVTLEQATAIATDWGARLPADETQSSYDLSLIRRMPADWSNLAPAERRAWNLDVVRPGRPTTTEPTARSGGFLRTFGSRRGRWGGRRQGVNAVPAQKEIEGEDPVADLEAAAVEVDTLAGERTAAVITESMPAVSMPGAPDGTGRDDGGPPADLAPLGDLRDVRPDAVPLVDEPASS